MSTALIEQTGDGSLIGRPVWSTNGRTLYYDRQIASSAGGLAAVAGRIESFTPLTSQTRVIASAGIWPSPSPNEETLASVVANNDGTADVWGQDLHAGNRSKLTDGRFVSVSSPRFSHDGQQVAFGGATLLAQTRPVDELALADPFDLAFWYARTAEAHEFLSAPWVVRVGGGGLRPIGQAVYDVPVVPWTADDQDLLLYDEGGLYEANVVTHQRQVVVPIGDHNGFDWLPNAAASSSYNFKLASFG